MLPPFELDQVIEKTVREEWGRLLACLVKSLGDFQLAEDCLQDAIASALLHWRKNGLPKSPAGWLLTTARRRAIDHLRKSNTASRHEPELTLLLEQEQHIDHTEGTAIPDERLAMIFTCCHPALEEKSRIALTLRTLGGLSTDEIAHAFLDNSTAMAQRLVRAKKKITLAGIPYQIPDLDALPERIASILKVIYLIFNEGYSASQGGNLTRANLSIEAIRLGRIITHLMPEEYEAKGLLALMLLHDSRRTTRSNGNGAMIALEHQNRARWDKAKIAEGCSILQNSLPHNQPGPYQLQAAISAVHAQSAKWEDTDWQQIVGLYDLLFHIQPTAVVRINQAVAVSFSRSIEDALRLLDEANSEDRLQTYQPYHAARADFFARLGEISKARDSLKHAIELSDNLMEREFLSNKLAGL